MAQYRGAQQDSRHDLAQYRRLVKLLHDFARELGGAKQDRQRDEHGHYIVCSQMGHRARDKSGLQNGWDKISSTSGGMPQVVSREYLAS